MNQSQDMLDETRRSYDSTAKKYQSKTEDIILEEEIDNFIAYIRKHRQEQDIDKSRIRILDLGCGPGRDAKIFSEKGYDVTGIDFSEEMLELAKKDAPLAKFYNKDIEYLDAKDGFFDGIWANASLIHIPKDSLEDTLSNLEKNIMKPRGIIYASFKQGFGEKMIEDSRYGDVKKFFAYYSTEELEAILKKTGLEIITSYSTTNSSDIDKTNRNYNTHPWLNLFLQKI